MCSFVIINAVWLWLFASAVYPTLATETSSRAPVCRDFYIPLKVQSTNQQIEDAVLTDESSVIDFLSSLAQANATYVDISQDIAISARYCEPSTRVERHADTIQLLVHGITYTKSYWTALDVREDWARNNSWQAYALSQGYATLNIDRPGNGLSTRIDPFWADQLSFQIAAINQLSLDIKNKRLLGRSFEKVVLVGHSFGSVIASFVAEQHPETLDGLLLTGYTGKLDSTPVFATIPLPASSVSPRFASLSSGYLATSSVSGRIAALYGRPGTYDLRFVSRDVATQDTVTIGEIATVHQIPSGRYRGPVAVITGNEDAIFCYDSSTKLGNCGSGETSIPAETRVDFPNASNFSYFIARTGHDINLHYRAPDAFAYAHAWLEENGF